MNPDEVEIRIASTLGAEDGPLHHLIAFKRAELTEKGRQMLAEMSANPLKNMRQGPDVAIPEEHMSFLKKVMLKGNLPDLYDARDLTEVVFRVMRDVMSTEEADRVESELGSSATYGSGNQYLQIDIADLWRDTNPIASEVRVRTVF